MLENVVNKLCNIMNEIGHDYEPFMDKSKYQSARSQIKHVIQNCAYNINNERELKTFRDYCIKTFDEYIPKVNKNG